MRSLQKHGEGKGFYVAYLKARIFFAIWYQPMNWLATIILPLQGIVRTRQVIRPETYIRGGIYVYT